MCRSHCKLQPSCEGVSPKKIWRASTSNHDGRTCGRYLQMTLQNYKIPLKIPSCQSTPVSPMRSCAVHLSPKPPVLSIKSESYYTRFRPPIQYHHIPPHYSPAPEHPTHPYSLVSHCHHHLRYDETIQHACSSLPSVHSARPNAPKSSASADSKTRERSTPTSPGTPPEYGAIPLYKRANALARPQRPSTTIIVKGHDSNLRHDAARRVAR